jgi:D-hydroxyproline dehydrogenase subunit alpha
MAAAVRAAETGGDIGLVDDNPNVGGQIWRGVSQGPSSVLAATWYERFASTRVKRLHGTRVVHQPEAGVLFAETHNGICELRYRKLILATGARELFLPFPGWTLPNVMGAGGLQAMVKSGLPIAGKRVVVAGSGPLLLAVASYLGKHGAQIPLICEQASWGALAQFSASLIGYPKKILQSLELRKDLSRLPFAANSWPIKAEGVSELESVTVSRAGKLQTLACDYLACGFHLVPNTELQQLLGCELQNGFVRVNGWQQTSVPDVFSVGEPSAIGGLDLALIEGQIAGLSVGNRADEAKKLFGKRNRARRFARILDRAFRLRPELRKLPSSSTMVCRCEDVTHERLQSHASWRAAKLYTRCGMGPCQGRVCGPAAHFLFDWNPESVRPPVFPARIESLAQVPKSKASAMSGDRG